MSTHPIARGIVISLNRNEKQELFKEIKNEKGLGVSATAQNGDQIKLGSAKYVAIQADNDRAVYLSVNDKLAAKVII